MAIKREIEKVLDKAGSISEQAEVFSLSYWNEPVDFEANRLKTVEDRESDGLALRIIKDGRIGFSSTNILDQLDGVVDNALETSPFGPVATLQFPSATRFNNVDTYDPTVETQTVDEMVHLGQSLIDDLRRHEPELLCDAGVGRNVVEISIANSNGLYASYKQSSFYVSVGATLVNGTDMFFLGGSKSSCNPILNIDELVASVLFQLENGRNISKPASGNMSVVFTPRGVAAALLSPLMAGFNGKSIIKGSSPLVGMLGETLVDERFSLWDEPLTPMIPGSRMFDDEGVPSRRMPLIDQGTISNFLYDLQTAGQAGEESTGNAHRGINSLPSPGVSVSVISSGDTSFYDMVADIEDGIIVESLLGAGQSNILSGDFSANVLLGYRIENGKIAGRLKNTVINGNVYSALNNISAIGNDGEWIGGSLYAPSIYCNDVSVATRG